MLFTFEIAFTLNGYETHRVQYFSPNPYDALRHFREDHEGTDPEVKQVSLVLPKDQWNMRAGNIQLT